MLSHDNLIFKMKMTEKSVQNNGNCKRRLMSYLPMSHVAAQTDLYKGLLCGACVYFADENALKVGLSSRDS